MPTENRKVDPEANTSEMCAWRRGILWTLFSEGGITQETFDAAKKSGFRLPYVGAAETLNFRS